LKKLKTNKVPGTDNLPAELLKYDGERLKQWLKHMFLLIWANEVILNKWLRGIIYARYIKNVISWYVLITGPSLC
jgi:hypothetical protein